MFLQLLIGAALISLTVVIHALILDKLIRSLQRYRTTVFHWFRLFWKSAMLTITVLGVFMAHMIQIWIWAVFYLAIGTMPNMEEALYFSTSTFTTVGFGDIVLDKDWRLVSSFQSANGFILFGWSTAFIFEVMSRLYHDDDLRKSGKP